MTAAQRGGAALLALSLVHGCRPPPDSPPAESTPTVDSAPCATLVARAAATPTEGRLPFTATLDGTASCGPDPIASWRWELDGAVLSGSQVSWTGFAAGTRTATLTVTDVFGVTASTTLDLLVHAQECPTALDPVVLGTLADDSLVEASGLVVGRREGGLFWTHNDSGHDPLLYAIGRDGRALGTWRLPVETLDWEDIAIGDEAGVPTLYLGDIGNNAGDRDSLVVYLLDEPTVDMTETPSEHPVEAIRTLTLRLPETLSADTLLVDPQSGDLYVISDANDGRAVVLRKPAPHTDGDDVTLEAVAELRFGSGDLPGDTLVTGGEISRTGDRIALRTRTEAWLWLRDGSQTVAEALAGSPCPIPLPTEPLGEALAFDHRDGGLLVTSEGAHPPLYWIPFEEAPACFSTVEAIPRVDPPVGPAPLTVTLDATESCTPGGLVSATWEIDGQTLEGAQVSWTGERAGTFPLTLTVLDASGASATAHGAVTVETPGCPTITGSEVLGTVADDDVLEVSGVAVSRRDSNVLWVHNDSGDSPRVFAIDRAGSTLGTWTLQTPRGDLEDIAASVGPDGTPELWVGDVGDNAEVRAAVTIYRMDEPTITDSVPIDHTVTAFDELTLVYPDGARNCESLLVDPLTRDLYLVTKDYDGESDVYRKAAPHVDGETATLEHVRSLTFGGDALPGGKPTTGGDISPDGSRIVVRTYNTTAWLWRRDPGQTIALAFEGEPCPIELPSEPQSEAVGFDVGSDALITISEREHQPIYRATLSP